MRFLASGAFAFGGMPLDKAEKSLRLFGEKVVPELKKMTPKKGSKATSSASARA